MNIEIYHKITGFHSAPAHLVSANKRITIKYKQSHNDCNIEVTI